jgi:thymidylate synthase
MNNLDKQYTALLQDILDNGVTKQDRTGTGTISVFGRQIRHKMSEGFPLLTTKKIHFKSVVTELLWFLRGDTNIKFLVDNDCHIWDGDAYKKYENHILKQREFQKKRVQELRKQGKRLKVAKIELLSKEEFTERIKTDDKFAKKWGELGPIYGKQWRSWDYWSGLKLGDRVLNDKKSIDQITNSINLLKTDPDSRRNRVNAWNVGELDQMTLPPCHTDFQFYTRELHIGERQSIAERIGYRGLLRSNAKDYKSSKRIIQSIEETCDSINIPKRAISLMWNQRSVDTFLGLPFNIASYGLLLEIIAKEVNMVPDELIGNLGDTHLYLNHVEQAKEQIGKIPWEERKEMLTDPIDIREFGNISPFTEPVIHYWLNYKNIPYSRRMPYPLPKLKHLRNDDKYKLLGEFPSLWNELKISDFELENYQSHPPIKAPLSN